MNNAGLILSFILIAAVLHLQIAENEMFARGENRTPDQGLMSPLLYR